MNRTKDWDNNYTAVKSNNESCWLHYTTPYRIIYDLFYKGDCIYNTHAITKEYKDRFIANELRL
jgi:hypothetical protein